MNEFKVGDLVEVIQAGYGFSDEAVGDRMRITELLGECALVDKIYAAKNGPDYNEHVCLKSFSIVKEAPIAEGKKSALDIQEGGGHYKSKGIQPVEYAYRNNLGFIESNVVKYVSRWKEKNGIQDLKKARHYLDILIEFEEKKEKQ